MRIVAERLYLRPLEERDCTEDYVAWLRDPEINRYLESRHSPQTLETVRDFVARMAASDNEHLFGIFLSAGDRHIGNIKVGPIIRHHAVSEVGLLIGAKDCWGKGYAGEAIAALSRHAFSHLGLSKLSASMYVPNQGSCSAFLKAGYKREGLRRGHYLLDGVPCDVIEVGLVPADLQL